MKLLLLLSFLDKGVLVKITYSITKYVKFYFPNEIIVGKKSSMRIDIYVKSPVDTLLQYGIRKEYCKGSQNA